MIARDKVPAALLESVRNSLQITWADDAADERLRGIIAAGTVYLDSKGGGALDYMADGLPRTLLMEYARYARDAALDVFETNYQAIILAMQTERQVTGYVESSAPTE